MLPPSSLQPLRASSTLGVEHPKFSQFNVTSAAYKSVAGQEIECFVLIPKTIHTGKRPIIAHFHGGFFITGHALFPDWAAQWSLEYTLAHNAIMVSPNYRLYPESNGLEILEDLGDFWTWTENDLPAYLKQIGSNIMPDYSKVLAYGESAGGYLAIQSGLTRKNLVKAIIAAYPMAKLDSPWYRVASTTKSPNGAPQIPKKVYEDHLKAMKKGKFLTAAYPPERLPLMLSTLQSGSFSGFGDDDSLFLDRLVDKTDGKVPFLFTYHGTEDRSVPCEETKEFVEKWAKKFGACTVVGQFEEGDHGFDAVVNLDTPWIKKGLERVTDAWIG